MCGLFELWNFGDPYEVIIRGASEEQIMKEFYKRYPKPVIFTVAFEND